MPRACFLLAIALFSAVSTSATTNNATRVRSVSLGGWLVIEKWIKPSLFDGIVEPDLLDGTLVTFESLVLGTYVTAANGGGSDVTANGTSASDWQTFKLWRVSSTLFQFRVSKNQFISAPDSSVSATVDYPGQSETFEISRNGGLVMLRAPNGMYLQANENSRLTADYNGTLGWSSDNPAVFNMTVNTVLGGEFQLANGYDKEDAQTVFKKHRESFITQDDFKFLAANAINNVRIPIGWWIAYDPEPPFPFVSGSLEALDNAFTWAENTGISVLVDLHAAPGSQSQWQHCGTRDGVSEWAKANTSYISDTLSVIEFLTSRYASHSAFFGIELLNEPTQQHVPLDVLRNYYVAGYSRVRKYSSSCFVIICQLIGTNPSILVDFMTPSDGYTNVALDVHWYNLFENRFVNTSAQWNIDYILNQRNSDLQKLNNANGPLILVGEWTTEWDVQGATMSDYRNFGVAQLKVFGNASLGWSYWGLKSKDLHWDFERTVEKGLLTRQSNGQWP
ncbi:probable glucan 1,3-beta-glucosidase A [Selaginella moellendorffii]|uniref:probable glucan 1,3-beta-glucosidase A n=1 Tax=Selaginella moellendorffii TaxID=88036 RepID=UPI000D1C4986|nr:probable glucan 1,3-beta-glucosidase A [Selaginella moellendorffii]|eukprot:XP_024542491.1 probable glucan 1,3-beta-glucosidase A [Selaginella moellendorffii]